MAGSGWAADPDPSGFPGASVLVQLDPATLERREVAGERTLTPARIEQGFKTQDHLDAFYRYLDHTGICPICSKVGGLVDIGDGMQPYMDRCDRGRELDAASHG